MTKHYFIILFLCWGTTYSYAQHPKQVIQDFLEHHHAQQGLLLEDVAHWGISSQHQSSTSGVNYVYIYQSHQGIPIINGTASIALQGGQVVSCGHRLVANIQQRIQDAVPLLSAEQAIHKAAKVLALPTPQDLSLLETINSKQFIYNKGQLSKENIPVQLVYYAQENGAIALAWQLSIYTLDAQHWWAITISAETGAILALADWVVHCNFPSCSNKNKQAPLPPTAIPTSSQQPAQYLVFPLPIESPNHGNRALVSHPADSLASPFGWHDTDGLLGAEHTITRGNNSHAYEDRNPTNTPGYSPDGGSNLLFQSPLNRTSAPVTYQAAAITNLFYITNKVHDIVYHYGFDEASGNFQFNNYNRGGLDGDAVRAEAQDGGGVNNATFAVPIDGTSPRMQLYIWGVAGNTNASFLKINAPLSIASGYTAANADFGPGLPSSPITSHLILVEDTNLDYDACDSITNAAALAGSIAVIDGGNCPITDKVMAAQTAGAVAVIIINTMSGPPVVMTGSNLNITIPSIMLGQTDGQRIKAQLANNTVNGSIQGTGIPHPLVDADLDNGILVHEYGHGITNRLTGGANNVNCLLNAEQAGEGWSDWLALLLTMKTGDVGTDARSLGTYLLGEPITGTGIRPAPYSTDFTINNYTYGDLNNPQVTQPHGTGFVFGTVLWELTWALINANGGVPDANLYTGTGGNNIAMKLVLEGLKLQPCSPGMLEARDAILQADQLLYNGANECLLWGAFARRGFGFSAHQGSSNNRLDQQEAFDLPPSCLLSTLATLSDSPVLTLAPNPSQGYPLLILSQSLEEEAQITLIDMTGSVQQSYTLPAGQQRLQLSGRPLPPAVYSLQLKNKKQFLTQKLVIN